MQNDRKEIDSHFQEMADRRRWRASALRACTEKGVCKERAEAIADQFVEQMASDRHALD